MKERKVKKENYISLLVVEKSYFISDLELKWKTSRREDSVTPEEKIAHDTWTIDSRGHHAKAGACKHCWTQSLEDSPGTQVKTMQLPFSTTQLFLGI